LVVDQVDNQSLVSQLRPDGPQRRFIDYYGILT
jgi:hypothetical protein